MPALVRRTGCADLIVDGKPFIALAGEVHNSSASDLSYMEHVWDRLQALNCNTAIVPVYWELLEPIEGQFDFTLVNGLISGARKRNLRLVLLWFATWKNSYSTYAPAWVKTNIDRFPRTQDSLGENTGMISAWSDEARDADARAFASLMGHIRAVDADHSTVLMVQIENEAGVLSMPRDYSRPAELAFNSSVPDKMARYLAAEENSLHPVLYRSWQEAGAKKRGTWTEIFGDMADEALMCWQIASYVDHIAAAGKAEYDLPMFVNAWLVQHPGQKAGSYPSGGPVSQTIDIWRCAASSIDFLAPDIYIDGFAGVCAEYASYGNPLFIPEAKRDNSCPAHALYAIAEHDALGFAPFGIESIGSAPAMAITGPVAEASLATPETSDASLLASTYALLAELMPVIVEHRGTGQMRGLLEAARCSDRFNFDRCVARIKYDPAGDDCAPAGGLIVALSDYEFLVAGFRLSVSFESRFPDTNHTAILEHTQGSYCDGRWISSRRLNGDEMGIHLGPHPEVRRIKLYDWPRFGHSVVE